VANAIRIILLSHFNSFETFLKTDKGICTLLNLKPTSTMTLYEIWCFVHFYVTASDCNVCDDYITSKIFVVSTNSKDYNLNL
jgi:hypothetical protein